MFSAFNARSGARTGSVAIGKPGSTTATCGCSYISLRYMQSHHTKLRKPQPQRSSIPIHWFFRTNIPRRRTSFLPVDMQKRNFFGLGEIVPAETVRSLTESKRLLDEARRDLSEQKERSQLRVLEGEPSFTVLFGASSVGKTAILREVLCGEEYHVLHFDLRIAGFADLASLIHNNTFEEIGKIDGYEEFEKESWGFKHDRLNVERRLAETQPGSDIRNVRTSDIARLMELFQSSLLKYREFEPVSEDTPEPLPPQQPPPTSHDTASSRRRRLFVFNRKGKNKAEPHEPIELQQPQPAPRKKIPHIDCTNIFTILHLSQFHCRPALIQSTETMKCLLDSMLVLTKQDRLAHVIHATSDPFYQTWLRQLNVMQHCKVIGDCSKGETRAYFEERIMPRVPRRLRLRLNFEQLYDAFGGKLAHWHDFCTDYVNSNGTLEIKQSSHFLQAHALLNLHLIHSSQAPSHNPEGNKDRVVANPDSIHPGIGPAGFKIILQSPTHMDLLQKTNRPPSPPVMGRLSQPDVRYLPYFALCRELGVRAVDGMVKGRVLDLRWTEPVTDEHVDHESVAAVNGRLGGAGVRIQSLDIWFRCPSGSLGRKSMSRSLGASSFRPPIMKFAMREVIEEYEDQRSVSDYVSLSEVEEY
ncbi:hypothetical protein R3P38DRAFT_2890638 [Favolaschia claudopus]|uniref:Uncharacterized protein n=1 Tax=Favolaschia claudopus TaxID=2862362 RepID=A0AAW0CR07_9AGAR